MKIKKRDQILLKGVAIGILIAVVGLLSASHLEAASVIDTPPDGAVRTDTLVSFTDSFKDDAASYWSEDREYAACVEMRTVLLPEEDDAQIQLVFSGMDRVILGSEDRTTMPVCDEKAVIHSHPGSGCNDKIWAGDLPSSEQWYREGGVAFLVQCAPDRVEVYTRDTGSYGKVFWI